MDARVAVTCANSGAPPGVKLISCIPLQKAFAPENIIHVSSKLTLRGPKFFSVLTRQPDF